MRLTYWVNKGLKGEKCFVEEFDNRDDLLAHIYGEAILERCFWLGKDYDTEFDMHVYVLNKKELEHALEYLDVLVSDSKSKKMTGLWYALNRELYDDGFKILVVAFEYE
jgi:hypothetical protein